MNFILRNPRLMLPVMVLVGLAIFGLRLGDVWSAASSGHLFARSALAESKTEAKPEAKADTPPAITPPTLATPQAAGTDAQKPAEGSAAQDSTASDEEVSPAEIEVLKQLSTRREELDKRGKDLDTRDALLKVAEQRLDQKIKEMETLRIQLQSMVGQASEKQSAQLDNLVKMYETMKPEEAAKIFEALDMPVLLNVIQRMKPKSTAPILAKMAPEKAKEITVALTKQDQLPQIK